MALKSPATRTVRAPFRYVCQRCRHLSSTSRRHLEATTSSPSGPSISAPPESGFARLPNRSLLRLTGPDAARFTHGLITASIPSATSTSTTTTAAAAAAGGGFYTAFLTAQGRVLYDVFIYPLTSAHTALDASVSSSGAVGAGPAEKTGAEEGFVIEVDAAERDGLVRHLKRHKLRSKITLLALDPEELGVYAVWRGAERWTGYGLGQGGEGLGSTLGLVDHRAPGMGKRILLGAGRTDKEQELDGLREASAEHYRIRRYLRGVPEGQAEIPREVAFPMNSNLDVMGAIDFKKGCYVGQELTIRTHHTGVVRRRILPVQLYDGDDEPESLHFDESWQKDSPKADAEVKVEGKRGRPGKWIAGIGNIGLATCRLEMMTDLVVSNEPNTYDPADRFTIDVEDGNTVGVKAFVPDWLRGKIRAPKVQRRVD